MEKYKLFLLLHLIGIKDYADGGGLGNEKTSEEFVVNLSKHLGDCWRVFNDKGSFFLNLGDTFLNGDLQMFPIEL